MLALYQAPLSLNMVAPPRASAPIMSYSWSQPGVGGNFDPIGLLNKPEKRFLKLVRAKRNQFVEYSSNFALKTNPSELSLKEMLT